MLLAQLQQLEAITAARRAAWARYHELLQPLQARGLLRCQIVPAACEPNGHMYFVLAARDIDRDAALARMRELGIAATFHFVPLHSAPAGRRLGRAHGDLAVTTDVAARLVRLPLWVGISEGEQVRVVQALEAALSAATPAVPSAAA